MGLGREVRRWPVPQQLPTRFTERPGGRRAVSGRESLTTDCRRFPFSEGAGMRECGFSAN